MKVLKSDAFSHILNPSEADVLHQISASHLSMLHRLLIYSYEEGSFRWFPDQLTFRFSCTEIGGSWQIHISSPTAEPSQFSIICTCFPQNWPNHIMGWCHPKWIFSHCYISVFLEGGEKNFKKKRRLLRFQLKVGYTSCKLSVSGTHLGRTLQFCIAAGFLQHFQGNGVLSWCPKWRWQNPEIALDVAWNGVDISLDTAIRGLKPLTSLQD